MFPTFGNRLTIPKECIIIFRNWALTRKACFLMSCNINLKTRSSLFMMVVFLESVMFSVSIPVVMVRTFQLPILRVGLFLHLCLSSDSFLVYFLVLQLILMHLLRKVNCGGKTPYWLKAAQLKVVVHWNVKIPPTDDSEPRRQSFRQTGFYL